MRRAAAHQTDGLSSHAADTPAAPNGPLIRGGLSQRIPGTHLAEGITDVEDAPMESRTARDPEAERDALNEYLSGFARAGDPDPELEARPTLAERHS
jgi:hypothetical protein